MIGEAGPRRLGGEGLGSVERITHERCSDLTTRYVFLLTYRSYTDPSTLLTELERRGIRIWTPSRGAWTSGRRR